MKTIRKIIALLCLLLSLTAGAQTTQAKYQREISAGYGVGVGIFGMDRFYLQTVLGMRVGKYFFTGLGIGANVYRNYIYNLPEVYMPIFLNAKGYLPVTDNTSLFISMDVGYSIGLTDGINEMSGLTFTPAVGANFNVSMNSAINIRLGYDCQRWESGISGLGINDGALAINARVPILNKNTN